MIASIQGTLEDRGTDHVVVLVGGLGLRVAVPASTLNAIGAIGEKVSLRTHLIMREELLALYGFATREELELFQALISVTGVGPRLALAMLSHGSVSAIREAISTGQTELLVRIPGLGRKLAGRIILELRGKLVSTDSGVPISTENAEIAAALTNLGYTQADIQTAISKLPTDKVLDLEDRILLALRHLSA